MSDRWLFVAERCVQDIKYRVRNKIIHSLPWITIFWSLMRWFANDFHSWLNHSWKSLANHPTRDQKSLFTVTHAFFYVYNSAPITHFSKLSEDPLWHNGHNRTDIAQFGRFQQSLGSLWHNYIVKLPQWTKTLLLLGQNRQDCPSCAYHDTACYRVTKALAESVFLSFLFCF